MRTQHSRRFRVTAMALAGVMASTPLAWGQEVESCPETSDPNAWAGATLDSDTTRSGVNYVDSSGGHLELEPAAGLFTSTSLGVSDLTVYASVADFDKDGWDDFVGAGEATTFLRVYENHTYMNAEPDWDDPSAVRTPRFDMVRQLIASSSNSQLRPTVAADFNGDTWPDVLHVVADWYTRPSSARMYLNQASNDASGYPRFLASYTAISTPSNGGYQTWSGTSIVAYDWNGDRKRDVLIGSGESNGSIRVFTNNCTTAAGAQPAAPAMLRCGNSPTFTYTATLITNLGTGTNTTGGLPVFAYAPFNSDDAYPDLIVGSPNLGTLRFYPGLNATTLDTANVRAMTTVGGVTGVMAADFSQDGLTDVVVTSDNWHYNSGVVGGIAEYFVSDGADFPFSAAPAQRLTDHDVPTFDYDVGFVFDYDHDPNSTPDLMIADGNHSGNFYVLANRVVDQYVDCGEIASGVIPLGDLATSEMVVTAARIDPTVTLNGGSITFWLTNEVPENWVEATDCGDGSGDLCATFPESSGRDVKWKATMCSNSTHTDTPFLTSISATFDFTEATEHYRAGVVVNDGVSYLGAFRQPGDRGKFYAVNAGLDQTYWDAATKLDAMSDSARNLYTAHRDTGERLDFESDGSVVDLGLVATLGAADESSAADVISWVRSARFGVGNTGIALSKLGAVETSTPAILTKPGLPVWYVFAGSTQREQVDTFLQDQADRFNLVMFGSKDGFLHALHTRPTNISNSKNGQEAWGFMPSWVATTAVADYSASLGADLVITAYPDGSPTLADVADANGDLSTIAVIAGGNGGRSISTLDVTETVDSETDTVLGPTPLWSATPGGVSAGQAFSKVAIARAQVDGEARFIAIAATGTASDDTTAPFERGRLVVAYDALTGEELWKFQTKCPVTSDVTVFETDDELEPGPPELDGFVDRAIFADRCGYLYKLDPARDLDGAWNDNVNMGEIEVDVVDGVQLFALFATASSSGSLGEESPIAGTLGAQVESGTSRMVLFFGTGGVEDHPVNEQNHFYGIYADDGSIRAKLVGTCDDDRCEKFYGGVVVTQEQVLFTRTVDPEVGTGTCDRGESVVQGVRLNEADDGEFTTDFSRDVGSAVMGALYGDAGAIYFATLNGEVVRVGEPRVSEAGGDSSGSGTGTGTGTGTGGTWDPDAPMTLMGWRQVF
jgi:hypothetical protein